MKFTIIGVSQSTSNVKVSFDIDGKEQVIANLPIQDADALKDALSAYGSAYESGLLIEQNTPSADVQALVGKVQTVTEG